MKIITPPKNSYYITITDYYLRICNGNECAAALIRLYEHRHAQIITDAQSSGRKAKEKIEQLTPARGETKTFRTVSVRNVCYIACRFDFSLPIHKHAENNHHHATIFHFFLRNAKQKKQNYIR